MSPPDPDNSLLSEALNGIRGVMESEFRGVRQQITDLSRRVDERHADLERRVADLEGTRQHWRFQWPSLGLGLLGVVLAVLNALGLL